MDQKKKLVEEDYFKCMAAFDLCLLLKQKPSLFKIFNSDSEEIKMKKKANKEYLMSQLGFVGEKTLKYIFGMRLLDINNTEFQSKSLDDFDQYFRGSNKKLNDIANYLGVDITSDAYKELINYQDSTRQKAHNFDFWYQIINVLMNDYMQKFSDYMKAKIISDLFIDYCKYEDFYYVEHGLLDYKYCYALEGAIFPLSNYSSVFSISDLPSPVDYYIPPDTRIEAFINSRLDKIKEYGDSFVRYRFAFNNSDDKEADLNFMFELIGNLVSFVKLIHAGGLNFDLDLEFAKKKIEEYADILKISKKDVQDYLKLGLNKKIYDSLFQNNFSYSPGEIKLLMDLGLNQNEIANAIMLRIRSYDIVHYREKGITELKDIADKKRNFIIGRGNY